MGIAKTIAAGISLLFAAANANADEIVDRPDADPILLCLNTIQKPSVVFATDKPTLELAFTASAHRGDASCRISVEGAFDKGSYKISSLKGQAYIFDNIPASYSFSSADGENFSYEVSHAGIQYSFPADKNAPVTAIIPAGILTPEYETSLAEKIKEGELSLERKNGGVILSISQDYAEENVPSEVQESMLALQISSLMALAKMDKNVLASAMERSIARKMPVLIPQ